MKDRLYLVEEDDGAPLQGRRVLVLSLQGDILQVVTHPTEPTAEFQSICCLDCKLLARYRYSTFDNAGDTISGRGYGMLALRGL